MPDASHGDGFPWQALPASVASSLRPEIPKVVEETIDAIRREVPVYNRPLVGRFGAGLRLGVEHALRQFVELITDPDGPQDHNTRIFRRLGRGELREGRSLDALQAAYRVGARVAWRHYVKAARRAGLSAEKIGVLADAVLTHINDMAAQSWQGYAEAQAAAATSQQRARERLLRHLLSPSPDSWETTDDLARQARWPLPSTAACVAIEAIGPAPLELPRLPHDILASTDDPEPYLLVPNPGNAGWEEPLRRVLRGRLAVVGLPVPVVQVRRSLVWARQTLRLVEWGAIARAPLVHSADHLDVLLLLRDEHLAHQVGDRVLRAFDDMTPVQRERMRSTLLAWLTSTGRSAPEVATRLGIHPQTVRYRMHQLTELFGDRLNDPDFRFEAEAALRAHALLTEIRRRSSHRNRQGAAGTAPTLISAGGRSPTAVAAPRGPASLARR